MPANYPLSQKLIHESIITSTHTRITTFLQKKHFLYVAHHNLPSFFFALPLLFLP